MLGHRRKLKKFPKRFVCTVCVIVLANVLGSEQMVNSVVYIETMVIVHLTPAD